MDKTNKSIVKTVKSFELPERQAKIDSLLKKTDQEQLYFCICRSTDSTSFMVACDSCEEWYHGHCININEAESKQIKRYYCDLCMKYDPTLKIEYRRPKVAAPTPLKEKLEQSTSPTKPVKNVSGPSKETRSPQTKTEKSSTRTRTSSPHIKTEKNTTGTRAARNPESDFDGSGNNAKVSRQCYAPECRNSARPNSKYCSSECGIALASARMYLILPSRMEEWSLKKPIADEHNDRDLLVVKTKQDSAKKAINELQYKRDKLDEHISRIERLQFDPEQEDDEHVDEGLMNCVSCSKEIFMKDSMKHMEKCCNKFELQTSFVSMYKTNVEGTPLFCDFLNPLTQTYCKRLKVLCPEHSKETKIRDTEICGCPLDNEVKPGGRICNNSKKRCNKHYSWEKLRRAEIDMEKVRQYLKLDELLEQERELLQMKQNRGGVLGLLLNSTIDHKRDEEVLADQEKQSQKEVETKLKQVVEQMRQEEEANKLSEVNTQSESTVKLVDANKRKLSLSSASEEKSDYEDEENFAEQWNDNFTHLPSKREKVRIKFLAKPLPVEMTASRLNKKK